MVRMLFACLVLAAMTVPGCSGQRLPPPPEAPTENLPAVAGVEESQNIRFWGDLAPGTAEQELSVIRRQVAQRIAAEGVLPNEGRFDILALSGGGSDGAYGAGLLSGWTERGDRPEFGLVTGISVGALIAPLAFLGPDYDDELRRLFTLTSTEDLVTFNIFRALFGWALGLTDVRPLEITFDRIITPELVRRIAEEHRKGRRLWIGTTHLDAQRPVIWDIGVIAASDSPRKRELIQKILLASAAIPGAFPPVMIPVRADGQLYAEMHVDGSVTRQIFTYPANVDLGQLLEGKLMGIQLGNIYVVRNSKLAPDYQPVDPSVLRIVGRSLFTLTNALALGDVEIIKRQAAQDGWSLFRTSVPPEFEFPQDDFFDPQYMTALYRVGYERAVNGIAWEEVYRPGESAEPDVLPAPAEEPDEIAAGG